MKTDLTDSRCIKAHAFPIIVNHTAISPAAIARIVLLNLTAHVGMGPWTLYVPQAGFTLTTNYLFKRLLRKVCSACCWLWDQCWQSWRPAMTVSKTHVELAQRHEIVAVTVPVSNSADVEYIWLQPSVDMCWGTLRLFNLRCFPLLHLFRLSQANRLNYLSAIHKSVETNEANLCLETITQWNIKR